MRKNTPDHAKMTKLSKQAQPKPPKNKAWARGGEQLRFPSGEDNSTPGGPQSQPWSAPRGTHAENQNFTTVKYDWRPLQPARAGVWVHGLDGSDWQVFFPKREARPFSTLTEYRTVRESLTETSDFLGGNLIIYYFQSCLPKFDAHGVNFTSIRAQEPRFLPI